MSTVLTLTHENFEQEVLKAQLPVLVDFWAPWCMPCRMMAPILDEIAKELDGKIVIGKMDVENPDHQALAMKYQISSIPNMKLFKNGQVAKEYVGLRDKGNFIRDLNQEL